MKKKLAILLVVFTLMGMCSCDNKTVITDEYLDYFCQDYHLVCVDFEESLGKTEAKINHQRADIYYTAITDTSSNDFVIAYIDPIVPFDSSDYYIIQNPTENIDILNNWTLKEVQLYCKSIKDGNSKPVWGQPIDNDSNAELLHTSTDGDLLNEVLPYLNSEREAFKHDEHNVMFVTKNEENPARYYIRLLFNESNSIVWDSEVSIYQRNDESREFIVTIDNGTIDNNYQCTTKNIEIPQSNALYDFILHSYYDNN